MVEVPGDRILLGFVLGNKVAVGSVNANRVYFERGVLDMALAQQQYPGWLRRLLTHPVKGLDNFAEMLQLLIEEKNAIKSLSLSRRSGIPMPDRAAWGCGRYGV